METQGYLFDKDGTLMELDPYWFAFIDHIVRKTLLALKCCEEPIRIRMMEIAGFDKSGNVIPESPIVAGTNQQIGRLWRAFLQDIPVPVPDSFLDDVMALFRTDFIYGKVIPAAPKLKAVLAEIKARGCKIGVATSDDYGSAKYCLEKLEVLDLIDDIFAADRVTCPKPAPDTMVLACKAWGMSPGNIVMVGDSENDMLFARNSGCKGV